MWHFGSFIFLLLRLCTIHKYEFYVPGTFLESNAFPNCRAIAAIFLDCSSNLVLSSVVTIFGSGGAFSSFFSSVFPVSCELVFELLLPAVVVVVVAELVEVETIAGPTDPNSDVPISDTSSKLAD